MFFASCSCSSEEKKWGPIELYQIAQKYDKNVSDVQMPPPNTPQYLEKAILCKNYPTEGCRGIINDGIGKRFNFLGIEIIVLRYDSTVNACKAALEIGQWYSRDWIFDDVTEEPILEDFVQKAYNAKKPLVPADCEF